MNKWDSLLITFFKESYDSLEFHDSRLMYRTIGNYDYMSVLSVSGENDGSNNDVYRNMWENTKRITENCESGSSHNLFGIKHPSTETEEFWNDKEALPFLFMSMIRIVLSPKSSMQEQLNQAINNINEFLDGQKCEIKHGFYYSLDSCDILLFIKTLKYEDGAATLHSMQSRLNCLLYCYSVFGINIKEIDKIKNSERIEKVTVCSVIKDIKSYQEWKDKIDNKYKLLKKDALIKGDGKEECGEFIHYVNSYLRLGNEDVVINIFNCELKDLLDQLMGANGLFSNENTKYKEALIGTRIHFDIDSHYMDYNGSLEDQKTGLEIGWLNRYKKEYNENIEIPIKKAIYELLRSCDWMDPYDLDVQTCIYNVYDAFIDEIKRFNDLYKNEERYSVARINNYNVYRYNEYIKRFINGVMSIANGCLHADKMFFQVPGFNAVLYDIPSKLLVFYTAFTQKITKLMRDNGANNKRYYFLLSPDLYQKTTVIKMFDVPNEKPHNRFLKVRIPVQMMFNPRDLMYELAHEVAHFSGDDARCRLVRTNITIRIIAETIVDKILSIYDDDLDEMVLFNLMYNNQEILGKTRKELVEHLVKRFSEIFKRERTIRNIDKEFFHYQCNTKDIFKGSFHLLLVNNNEIDQILAIISKNIKEKVGLENQVTLVDFLNRINDFRSLICKHIASVKSESGHIIEDVHRLANESYADLVMRHILNIDKDTYLHYFYDINKEKGLSFLNIDATAERILSVLKAKGEEIDHESLANDQSDYRSYLFRLKNHYKNNHQFLPEAALEYNAKYLVQCYKKLQEKNEDQYDEIRTIFKNFDENNIIDSIHIIKEESFSFQEELLANINGD